MSDNKDTSTTSNSNSSNSQAKTNDLELRALGNNTTNPTAAATSPLVPGNNEKDNGNNNNNSNVVLQKEKSNRALVKDCHDRIINNPPSPEFRANFFSLLTFSWLNSLFYKGYKRPLETDDLYELNEKYFAHSLSDEFAEKWKAEQERAKKANAQRSSSPTPTKKSIFSWKKNQQQQPAEPKEIKPSLLRTIFAMFGREWTLLGLAKLISDGTQLTSPILIEYIIDFVQASQTANPPPEWEGYVFTVVLFTLQILGTICLNFYFQRTMLIGVRVRTTMISTVYRKMLKLNEKSRQDFNGGKIINIVSSDTSRMDSICGYGHMLWSGPVQLIVTIALLIRALGPAALVGVGILVALLPVQAIIMKRLAVLRGENAKITDQRVRTISEILQGIRVIKFFAWEDSFMKRIASLRSSELTKVRSQSIIKALASSISFGIPVIASALSFVVYYTSTGELNAAKIFSSLALFNILRFPLMILPMVFGMLADLSVALRRIQGLLEAGELESQPELVPNAPYAVKIVDADFVWEVPMEEKQKAESKEKPSGKGKGNEKEKEKKEKDGDTALSPTTEKEAKPPTLSNVNLEIPRGALVAIIGSVGAGKSSLLQGIIGEMTRTRGKVYVGGSLGYAPQQAWIQNATVEKNITFGLPLETEKYKEAITKCALTKDLEILPHGDQTEIGERGINLSGGQKQRVSLARCVYLNNDIVLLDDPLSAVDSHVGRYIFENCISGVLADRTRILVTHQLHFVPKADYIIVMDHGAIVEQGSFTELMESSNGLFKELMDKYGGIEEESDGLEEEAQVESTPTVAVVESDKDGAPRSRKTSEKPKKDLIEEKSKDAVSKKLMTTEERALGAVEWKVFVAYFQAAGGWAFIAFMAVLLLLTQATRLGNDIWLVQWTDNRFPDLGIGAYIAIYVSLGVAQTLAGFFYGILFAFGGVRAARGLHNGALENVLHAKTTFFDTTPLGRIINRFSKDIDTVDNSLGEAFRMFTTTLGTAVATLILNIYATPIFAAPLVVLLCVYYLVQLLYRRTSRELKRLDSICRSPLYANFAESMSGMSTIRAYGHQVRFIDNNDSLMNYNNEPYYLQVNAQRWLAFRLEFIGAVLVFFASLLGIIARDTISAALVGLSLSYVLQVTGVLNWGIRQWTETEIQMNSVERIEYYAKELALEAPPVVADKRPPPDWPREGTISIQGLELRYQPHLPAVLHDLSLDIKGGEKIGVVGRTGSGKSSLMNALFRMVEPSTGKIMIDNINILEVGLKDLRTRIAIIPQDPILFSGTIRTNIDPFDEHDDEFLWKVLEKSGLKDSMSRMEGKLEAKVNDNGDNLSVGQRQLLCLARAIARKPKIIVMDEATANVDMTNDELIQKAIREEFAQSTILCIAHRLNTVIDYDRILVLENGIVKEFGAPGELLANENSEFSKMVNETGPSNAALLRSLSTQ